MVKYKRQIYEGKQIQPERAKKGSCAASEVAYISSSLFSSA